MAKPPTSTTDEHALRLELPARFWQSSVVLVAVSGGSDSLALALSLQHARKRRAVLQPVPELLAFHFDHRWHEDSANLASWVEQTLAAHGVPTIIRRRDDGKTSESAPCGTSVDGPQSEGDARRCRYAAMELAARATGASFVATGHTRDDQVETVLMRIARGTGISGLAGIPNQREFYQDCWLIRPLLSETRQRLRDYLHSIGQEFWDDPTNTDLRWTRNRVRCSVLPWLRQNFSTDIDQSLLRLSELASDHQKMLQYLAETNRAAVLELTNQSLVVDVRPWSALPENVVRSLLIYWWERANLPLQEMDFDHWCRLTRIAFRTSEANSPDRWPSEFHFPGHVVAKRSGGILRISVDPMKTPNDSTFPAS
ncbi:MAG: tRNA lysidine(34) synthetase TilS [Planctomycetaceae bacterium]|nr:tRNA lysidine(34) synthetase TilS [Planctomycetaceae bacterium]